MAERRCIRCSKLFTPTKPTYRYCPSCFSATQPSGWTEVTRKPGTAHHRIGGVSRLRTSRRSVVLRGDDNTSKIFSGLQIFLTAIYGKSTRVSTLLRQKGLNPDEIERLNESQRLGCIAMDICPKLQKWMNQNLGYRPCAALIDYYGIYGDDPLSAKGLVERYGFQDESHAQNYIRRMVGELNQPERKKQLEDIFYEVASDYLRSNR